MNDDRKAATEQKLKCKRILTEAQKERQRQTGAAWKKLNQERVNAAQRERRKSDAGSKMEAAYRERYKEKAAKRQKARRQNIEAREKHRMWSRERARYLRKTSAEFRIKANLRARIRDLLKRSGTYKTNTTLDYLGCSLAQFKAHLQSKFKKGMTWKNQGRYGWHVDHIIPCASFDLTKEDERRKCFHWSNHQPLWASENYRKHAKIVTCQPELGLRL
jgi:hypothetical protein